MERMTWVLQWSVFAWMKISPLYMFWKTTSMGFTVICFCHEWKYHFYICFGKLTLWVLQWSVFVMNENITSIYVLENYLYGFNSDQILHEWKYHFCICFGKLPLWVLQWSVFAWMKISPLYIYIGNLPLFCQRLYHRPLKWWGRWGTSKFVVCQRLLTHFQRSWK